jgi:hypothetical protein
MMLSQAQPCLALVLHSRAGAAACLACAAAPAPRAQTHPAPPTRALPTLQIRIPKVLYDAVTAGGGAGLLNTPNGSGGGGIKALRGVAGPRPGARPPSQRREHAPGCAFPALSGPGSLPAACCCNGSAAAPANAACDSPADAGSATPLPPSGEDGRQLLFFDPVNAGSYPPRPHLARATFDEAAACCAISAAMAAAAAGETMAARAPARCSVGGGGGGGDPYAWLPSAGAEAEGDSSGAHGSAADPEAPAPLPSMRPGTAQVKERGPLGTQPVIACVRAPGG